MELYLLWFLEGYGIYSGPGRPLTPTPLFGATAFLAAAQKMPITAIVLIFEFTHFKFGFVVPILCAVVGSMGVFYALESYFNVTRKLKNSSFYP